MKSVTIVGSGTAGLCSAIYIKFLFPTYDVSVISSSSVGIIGVGEGSTEHWRDFQNFCNIDPLEMIRETRATHKYGIRFEGWTNHTPDYFHSVSDKGFLFKQTFVASYNHSLINGSLLTDSYSSLGLRANQIEDSETPHLNTNQYHFDTFKLNQYFTSLCLSRGITMIDGDVEDVVLNAENGFIQSVKLKNGSVFSADFFIDASGFHRVLMSRMEDQTFVSYSDYLPCDKAIAFPTASDPSGQIRPYTRAIALNSGWMWEIPTQDRRGNGYAYSSEFCSDDEAVAEASVVHGFDVVPAKFIKFKAGYYRKTWQKNCVAVGLASSFVEPLEATSIGSTLQQIKALCSYLPTFSPSSNKTVSEYHRIMDSIMENILSMISLHYVSDRSDTPMWEAQQNRPLPDLLTHLLELWSERSPEYHDIPSTGFELFGQNHFWHVAQGQGVLNRQNAQIQMDAYGAENTVNMWFMGRQAVRHQAKLLDHAKSLSMLQ